MKKDNKIVLSIIIGGSIFIVILLTLFVSLIGNSSDIFSSYPNGDTVTIIPLQGEIGYGSSSLTGESIITPKMVQEAVKNAETDSSVSSILININSPGGSPVASEEIMNTINSSKKTCCCLVQ